MKLKLNNCERKWTKLEDIYSFCYSEKLTDFTQYKYIYTSMVEALKKWWGYASSMDPNLLL
jgi:archaellum biogenesis protein FlaJ (TadC family)